MNREEKEEYVIRLYKAGRTVRQIAGLVYMSFRDIGVIINKVKAELLSLWFSMGNMECLYAFNRSCPTTPTTVLLVTFMLPPSVSWCAATAILATGM
jgi:hypothetical protein